MSSEIVCLNVGGVKYTTSKHTLTKYPESMLGAMFSQNYIPSQVDKDGCYFIDRNGKIFEHILQFLRSGEFIPPDKPKELKLLKCEAEFFQIIPLLDRLIAHEKSIVTYHQIRTVCISNIILNFPFLRSREKFHFTATYKNFIFQSVNNNTFKMIHRQENAQDCTDRSILNSDIENKAFIKSIINDAWILYEKKEVSSYNELVSFLILNGFECTSFDFIKKSLSNQFFSRDGDQRLIIFCYVKPDDNKPIMYHV